MEREFTCCMCGKKFTGYGNDPWPIKDEGECCDSCNEKVAEERMLIVQQMTDDPDQGVKL